MSAVPCVIIKGYIWKIVHQLPVYTLLNMFSLINFGYGPSKHLVNTSRRHSQRRGHVLSSSWKQWESRSLFYASQLDFGIQLCTQLVVHDIDFVDSGGEIGQELTDLLYTLFLAYVLIFWEGFEEIIFIWSSEECSLKESKAKPIS